MDSIDDLLCETSRTFALTIPLLPEPTRRATCLAYLLFRVSDTFEDAGSWTRQDRIDALRAWCAVLRAPGAWQDEAQRLSRAWLASSPSDHEGYLRLIAAIPEVLAEVARLPEGRRAIVVDHAIRSADGMAEVLGRAGPDGWIRLSSLPELRAYCYTVAGIVGELLTSLFLHNAPVLAPDRGAAPRERASVRRGAPAGEHPERRARRCQGGAPLPPPRCPAIGGGEARAQGPRLRGGVHRIAGPRRRPHRLRRVHGMPAKRWPERPLTGSKRTDRARRCLVRS